MAKVDVYNMEGAVTGQIELSDEIFGIEPNEHTLHTMILNRLANARQGTSSTKTRSEVSGGGRKPYRQKGTGRARQGSIRSAQHVGGGIIFGPKPRDYRFTVPKKIRRLAMKSALSTKLASSDLVVVEDLAFDRIKTKEMIRVLGNLKIDKTALIVIGGKNANVELSARNLAGIKMAFVNTINVYDILKHEKFVITRDAVEKVQEVYV
ncbi:MAG TPA: 50S ribosomal protein L4 [Clostridia bacterium]